MEFVKFPISKFYPSKYINRDIFGKKLRMKDVLLISFEPFFAPILSLQYDFIDHGNKTPSEITQPQLYQSVIY